MKKLIFILALFSLPALASRTIQRGGFQVTCVKGGADITFVAGSSSDIDGSMMVGSTEAVGGDGVSKNMFTISSGVASSLNTMCSAWKTAMKTAHDTAGASGTWTN